MLVIRDGAVITGDGTTILNPATVYVEGDRILEVRSGRVPLVSEGDTVLDAHDHVVFPGLINIHTHGCTTGPFLPTAAAPLSREQALKNLDKHLSFGTTTIVNADGFVLPEEAAEMDSIHPTHLPAIPP